MKLHRFEYIEHVDIDVAAPDDMPAEDVLALVRKNDTRILDLGQGRLSIVDVKSAGAEDAGGDVWVVLDDRTRIEQGEDTEWLQEEA